MPELISKYERFREKTNEIIYEPVRKRVGYSI